MGHESGEGLNRREVLAAGALLGAAVAVGTDPSAAVAAPFERRLAFGALGDGDGWPGWAAPGVANLRRAGGEGVLEAGSDVFPHDPRPVAFALDLRVADGEIAAELTRTGAAAGVVLRRTGPRAYYAALYDTEASALRIVRRLGDRLDELARAAVAPDALGRLAGPVRLSLAAEGARPARLTARLEAGPVPAVVVRAQDATPELQGPGDPGVLATARTLFPSEGPTAFPALGNVHLLPYSVQEGQAVMETPAGQAVIDVIRERSTAAFAAITVRSPERPRVTAPSVVAASTGAPVAGGAILRVASDVSATVAIEVAADAGFRRSRLLPARATGDFDAALATAVGLRAGRIVHWRARLRRRGVEAVGPARSFRVLPRAGSPRRVRLAIGSCAAQFGPTFDVLAARRPDVFVWQGDLNYPDTLGPLAQTMSGYAGIWRELLANPRLAPVLDRACFAVQRDDHDLGIQDANAANLVPWGVAPWNALMEARPYYRFPAGLAEVWVLDQRQFKSAPGEPDTPDKTLLGARQRAWLLRTLAASTAPFKIVCSPCTLAPLPANTRDGSWATGFTAERDLLLAHIADRVAGTTLFVTGDTHWTMAYDRGGLFEARPCPLGIPAPNDITLTQPHVAEDARRRPGVAYADDEHGHVAVIDVAGDRETARLELALVREDGVTAYRKAFSRPRR
jgi:hypothetical protein